MYAIRTRLKTTNPKPGKPRRYLIQVLGMPLIL